MTAIGILLLPLLVLQARHEFTPEELAHLEQIERELRVTAAEAGRHLVRVRMYREMELRMYDGRPVDVMQFEEGVCHGVVVSHEPIIMVSGSAGQVEQTGMVAVRPRPATPEGMSDRLYALLLGKRQVPAEVVRHDRGLNLVFLRPIDRSDLPWEQLQPLSLAGARRLSGLEPMAVPVFRDIYNSARTTVLMDRFSPAKEQFTRPALRVAGLGHMGAPVLAEGGVLAGVVNLPPPEEGLPPVRVDPHNRNAPPGRDPAEWNSGYRRAVLVPAPEIVPVIEELIAAYEQPFPLAALGVEIANRGPGLVVHSVQETPSALLQGDEIVAVAGTPVRSVQSFLAAFEAALEASAPPIAVEIRRAGEIQQIALEL